MTLLYIFGLLAFASFIMPLAAKTCTLWKLGLTFFCNWILSTLINFSVDVLAYKASLYSTIDFISVIVCAEVYFKYKCKTSLATCLIFIGMTIIHFSAVFFEMKGWLHPLLNILFVSQALTLITVSVRRIVRRNRRRVSINPRGIERRRREYLTKRRYQQADKVDYV